MPGRDGTGPSSQGPIGRGTMTGRRQGYCGGSQSDMSPRGNGRGMGNGNGRGMGNGNGRGWRNGGWCRRNWLSSSGLLGGQRGKLNQQNTVNAEVSAVTDSQTVDALKRQIRELESTVAALTARITGDE